MRKTGAAFRRVISASVVTRGPMMAASDFSFEPVSGALLEYLSVFLLAGMCGPLARSLALPYERGRRSG